MVDPETFASFRSGDATAFEAVVRAYGPMVFAIVRKYWAGEFQREDAMQEVWTQVWRQRAALDPDRLETFGPWLTVLARRRCLDLLRAEGREVPTADDPEPALAGLAVAPPQEDATRHGEVRRAVQAFRERLKPAWRTFFDLHLVSGLEYPEVQARLGINQARCKYMKRVILGRARKSPFLAQALDRTEQGGRRAS